MGAIEKLSEDTIGIFIISAGIFLSLLWVIYGIDVRACVILLFVFVFVFFGVVITCLPYIPDEEDFPVLNIKEKKK
jgi:vacuolar-type H+-ATPase subunit I/STV1